MEKKSYLYNLLTKSAILNEYPNVPTKVLAAKYGIPESSIRALAKRYDVKKDFEAQRAYRESLKPVKPKRISKSQQRKLRAAKRREARKQRNLEMLADYGHRSSRELAAELGITVEALHKRAQRAGLRKAEDFKPVLPKREESYNTKLIKALGTTCDYRDIATRIGLSPAYVRNVLHKAGITPIDNRPKQVVVQYTMDWQPIARFNNKEEAARALGHPNGSLICQCCLGKKKHAYGYRWSVEQELK